MPARPSPAKIASDLRVPERVMLFCLASGTDWERAGVTHATAQQMLVRGLIDRDPGPARFKLSRLAATCSPRCSGRRSTNRMGEQAVPEQGGEMPKPGPLGRG